VAALTGDGKALTVAIVNATETGQEFDLAFQGTALRPPGRLWRIAGADLNPRNDPGKLRDVDIVENAVMDVPGRLALPKLSISIYEFPVR